MSSINSINSNRITGLATGMDTDQMVKNMMKAELAKVEKYRQRKQCDEWRQEIFIGITKDLKELHGDYLDILKAGDNNLLKSSAYTTLKSSMSDEDSKSLDVKGLPGAMQGSYKVKVNKLASGARVQSNISDLSLDKKLSDFNLGDGENIEITIGSDIFKIDIPKDTDKTLGQFIDDLKNTRISTVSGEKALSSVAKINFSSITNKLTIETVDSGENSNLKIQGSMAEKLGINTSTDVKGNDSEIEITIPGETQAVTLKRNSNNFTIDNITFNLKAADVDKEISFELRPEAKETADKIEKFVNKYNDLVKKISGLVEEKKNYSFKPLTESQKESMSEKAVERWEKKAKEGLVRNDGDLQRILIELRSAFTDGVKDAGLTYKQIGLDTSSDTTERGKIILDKDKLKAALENNGDAVFKLFTNYSSKTITSSSTKEEKTQAYNENGIFRRIKNIIDDYTGIDGFLIRKAGYEGTRWAYNNDLSKSIAEQDKKIQYMERVMYAKEDKYYQMFAKLEKTMNNLNAQSSWLMAQLGGGQ